MKTRYFLMFLFFSVMLNAKEYALISLDREISLSLQGSNRYYLLDYSMETLTLISPFLEFGWIGMNKFSHTTNLSNYKVKATTSAFIIDAAMVGIIKYIVHRQRPERIKYHPRLFNTRITPSFPSGHASISATFATVTSTFYPEMKIPLFLYAILSAYSQVYVGNHYISDVVGGVILGFLVGRLTIRVTHDSWISESKGISSTKTITPLYLTISIPLSSK